MPDVDSVFDQIRDLAAVRIATYEQTPRRANRSARLQAIHRRSGPSTRARAQGQEPRAIPRTSTEPAHLEVFLAAVRTSSARTPTSMDVPCEVQVCSMMAHVWNEIEHDLGYKPDAATLSEQEKNFLVMLGQSVRGRATARSASLFAETERRNAEQASGVHRRLRLRRAAARLVSGCRLWRRTRAPSSRRCSPSAS